MSADFPFTVTSTGELAATSAEGKGWPGSTPGRVGPSPVAKRDNVSPAAAGLDAVTRLKSLECATAGPPAVFTISGRDNGITCKIRFSFAPPLVRRLAGSSLTEAL